MKKRFGMYILLSAILLALLSGCGHQHSFAEATCEKPRTCTECGATEGEAAGHDWADATCTAPQTCQKCGAVEGEPLEHTLTEPNYQTPATCTMCGATVGEVLTPAFVQYGLECTAELDREYDYHTHCLLDNSQTTVGTVAFKDFACAPSVDGLPEREGYVWLRVVTVTEMFDDNAWKYGFFKGTSNEDYYDIQGHDDSMVHYEAEENPDYAGADDFYSTYRVSFRGQEYECERITRYDTSGWVNHRVSERFTDYFHIPEGYDGTVVGVFDKKEKNDWKDGMYIFDLADENAIFLRLTATPCG